jgi:hypothetical protein
MIRKIGLVLTASAAGAALAMAGAATAGASTTPHGQLHAGKVPTANVTKVHGKHGYARATTKFTNVPDSGDYGGYWAVDNYTQVTTVRLVGKVAATTSGCGAAWSACYEWKASVADSGTTTTIPGKSKGAKAIGSPGFDPRTGTVQEWVAEKIKYSGGSPSVIFYASRDKAYASLVPKSENDNYNTNPDQSGATNPFPFVNRFFAKGTGIESVADMNDGHWSWTYTLRKGGDSSCRSYGPATWTDAWDVAAADSGDIYAYGKGGCPAS